MDDNERSETKPSQYPAVVKPEFKSDIPPHLLKKLSEQERWMCESISTIQAATTWLVDRAVGDNTIYRQIDQRVTTVEEWKTFFSGKWAVLGGTAVVALAAVSPEAFHLVVGLFKH